MSNDIQWTNNHLAFRSRKLIWLSALLIVSIIGWATWATLEEVVIGEGKVDVAAMQSLQMDANSNLGDDMIPSAPRQLQNDHRLGSRIGANHFTRLAEHAHRAAEERRFAGDVILDLSHKIIARSQIQIEAKFSKT